MRVPAYTLCLPFFFLSLSTHSFSIPIAAVCHEPAYRRVLFFSPLFCTTSDERGELFSNLFNPCVDSSPPSPSSEDLSVPRSPSDLGLLSAATAVVSLLLRRRRFMQKRFQIIRFISYSTTGSCSM